MRWLTSTLLAASTTPDRVAVGLEAAHAVPVLAEKLAPENLERRFRRRLVAEIARITLSTPSASSRRTARYFSYQLLATVGDLVEMFACKNRPPARPAVARRETSSCRARRRQRRPPSGRAVPWWATSSASCAFSVALLASGSETERFQAIALRVLETDRPAGRLAPARFFVPVRAKRNPVKRNGAGTGDMRRYALSFPENVRFP